MVYGFRYGDLRFFHQSTVPPLRLVTDFTIYADIRPEIKEQIHP
jgi:hypothetical protein